ncbi:MAG: hypothetical protein JHC93_05920, partial [Parachlamydiales bacterium]|nr:hypothetical protein [Parachlamydiales bacterium]
MYIINQNCRDIEKTFNSIQENHFELSFHHFEESKLQNLNSTFEKIAKIANTILSDFNQDNPEIPIELGANQFFRFMLSVTAFDELKVY